MLVRCLGLVGLALFAATTYADTYDYSVKECNSYTASVGCQSNTYFEFQITNPPAPDSYTATSFTYDTVDILQVGTSAMDGPSVTLSLYGVSVFGQYSPEPDTFSLSEYDDDLRLFAGSTSDPTLLTGGPSEVNPQHTFYQYGNGADVGYLTVTDLDAVPTPEPAPWLCRESVCWGCSVWLGESGDRIPA